MATVKPYFLNPNGKALVLLEMLILGISMLMALQLTTFHAGPGLLTWPALPEFIQRLLQMGLFALLVQFTAFALGLYSQELRENFRGIVQRLFFCFLFCYLLLTLATQIFGLMPVEAEVYALAAAIAFVLIATLRFQLLSYTGGQRGQRRILVLGAGQRAAVIERRMRRKVDRRRFEILNFVAMEGDTPDGIGDDKIIRLDGTTTLHELAKRLQIQEIVVACDERRDNLPVKQLFECKLHGINVTDILDFIEQETSQIAVNLIYPSWVIYSKGFRGSSEWRAILDRLFNTTIALVVLLLTWPLMLITVLCIWCEDGFGAPVLYRQRRVGMAGCGFDIYKFRSMSIDAEKNGAQWAQNNDCRVTRVGAVIRKYRIDELPQLYNVLMGEMGFIGPRPERPEFVCQLVDSIPYYNERHHVKPGLTGWAQLRYPYGASKEDALEKLKFDLYYIKNRSFLFDLLILLRTAEIVIFGKGVR